MSGILCSGKLYIDRTDTSGNKTGLVSVGNATQFQITESSSTKTRTSRMNDDYGQVLDTVAIKGDSKLAVTMDELDRANLALIFLGLDVDSSQAAAASQTKEFDLGSVKRNVYYELGHTNVTVSNVAVGGSAMADGSFQVDTSGGLVMFTDSAPASGSVTVTFSAAKMAGYKIKGGARPTIKARLLLIGKNLADETNVQVDVKEAVLTPKSGLDFLSSDFATAQLEGTLNKPAGEDAPYYVTVLDEAA